MPAIQRTGALREARASAIGSPIKPPPINPSSDSTIVPYRAREDEKDVAEREGWALPWLVPHNDVPRRRRLVNTASATSEISARNARDSAT